MLSEQTPPYLRDSNTKRIFIYTTQLAKMATMEPYFPKGDHDDPCKQGAKRAAELAAAGVVTTNDNPLLAHIPPAKEPRATVIAETVGELHTEVAVADHVDDLPANHRKLDKRSKEFRHSKQLDLEDAINSAA